MHNECTAAIETLFKSDMKRSIVHALLLAGGKGDFKQIKQMIESKDVYLSSEHFEEQLLAVTN